MRMNKFTAHSLPCIKVQFCITEFFHQKRDYLLTGQHPRIGIGTHNAEGFLPRCHYLFSPLLKSFTCRLLTGYVIWNHFTDRCTEAVAFFSHVNFIVHLSTNELNSSIFFNNVCYIFSLPSVVKTYVILTTILSLGWEQTDGHKVIPVSFIGFELQLSQALFRRCITTIPHLMMDSCYSLPSSN